MSKLTPRLLPLLLLTAAPTLWAAGPATQPTPTPDYSDPRKTVAAFLLALQSTDPAAIKSALVIAPDDVKITDTIINLSVAQSKLRTAAEKKFGDPATQYFGAVSSQIESRLQALQTAPLKITGDSALLSVPADETAQQSAGTIILKKIGNAWKLDATTLFNLAAVPPEVTAQRVALAAKLITVTDGITTDITAGKFPSAGEAYQEFWNRSLAVSRQIDAGTTTKPGQGDKVTR
jgi:hypothetical protein